MEEEKGDFNPAVPAAAAFTEPKIKCNRCTYDNELTNDHCEMCDNPLYIWSMLFIILYYNKNHKGN